MFLRHGATVDGMLSLNGAYVGLIVDEPESWPNSGDLMLNWFRYGGFLGSPVEILKWQAFRAIERDARNKKRGK
jgi:hypothetical protein